MTSFTPVKPQNRIALIDILRGFALFGILMVNMPLMYNPISRIMLGAKTDLSSLDLVFEYFIRFFFEGKFYVLFSMLFGYGFYLFLQKKNETHGRILLLYTRRLFFLLLFGILHVVLLWAGDILVFYALFGFILMLYRNSSTKKLFRWAMVFIAIPSFLSLVFYGFYLMALQIPEAKAGMEEGIQSQMSQISALYKQAATIYSEGNFAEMRSMRIQEYLILLPGVFFFYPVVLGMFLIGMRAAKMNLIANYQNHIAYFRRLFRNSLIVAIPANIILVYAYQNSVSSIPSLLSVTTTLMSAIGGISMSLVYISGIVILYNKHNEKLGKWFAPVGRMALTNYLMQSVITSFLFLNYGLGWYGMPTLWQGILLTILIYLIQLYWSRWWLSNYLYGPFEWLWRSLTYLKLQPFRRR